MSSAPGKVRPSGFWYLLPLVLVIGGGVAAIVFIVSGVNAYSSTIEDFARVEVGDSGTIEIDGTGGYTVFYEPGVADESSLDETDPHPTVTITDPSGQQVPLEDYDSLGTYGSSGYVGIAIQTFDVDAPGRYGIETSDQVLGGAIAVGRSPFTKITRGVVVGLLAGFAGFVLGLVVLISLMVSRGRSKRRLRAANPYVPYAAPAWSGGPQPGYPQPPQYPQQPQYPPVPPPAAPAPPPAGGFGPPPGRPPAAPPPGPPSGQPPAAPPPPPADDSTPGWGQPQQ